jgi:Flp pilus assembly protein TadG
LESRRTCTRRLLDTKGQTLVVFVLFLFVLVGMAAVAIDVGNVYFQQARLQAAVDAGALAGAKALANGDTQSQAQTAAEQLATTNVAGGNYTATAGEQQVSITGTETVPTFLAGLFGIKDWHLNVNAAADIESTNQTTGIMPFGVTKQTIEDAQAGSGTEVPLTANTESAGNWGYLSINGTGSQQVKTNIENGATGTFSIGQSIQTETGVETGPVGQAIDYRISEDSSNPSCASYSTATGACHRVVIVPIVQGFSNGTSAPVTVVGFAEFYLQNYQAGVYGYFIKTLSTGSGSTQAPPFGAEILGLIP